MGSHTKSLPISEDNECALLCSMMRDPEALAACQDLPAKAFAIPANQILYKALCEFRRKKKPIDFILLKSHLQEQKINRHGVTLLDEVGGVEGLNRVYDFLPCHWYMEGNERRSTWPWYKDLVKDYHHRRQVIVSCRKLEEEAHEPWIKMKAGPGIKLSF